MGLSASCHMLLIGIGAGDPRQITLEAVEALNRADVFFILDKGAGKDELRHLREAFCQRHIAPERSWRMVVLEDPKRPPVSTAADQGEAYHAVVKAWHRARVSRLTTAIKHHLLPGQTGAFLVWGDPMLYDSMLRLVEQLQATVTGGLEYTVIRASYSPEPYWRVGHDHHGPSTAPSARTRFCRTAWRYAGHARRGLRVPARAA